MASHSSFSSLPGDVAKPTTYPVKTPKESGVSDSSSSSGTPAPSPTAPPATQPMPTSTPSVAPSSSQPASSRSSGGSVSNADIDAYLKAHNDFRGLHGANALTWSTELSATAQAWADGCIFKHSGAGENLAAGTGGLSIQAAIAMWTDESRDYDPSNPVASHFTQVVWKATTQLGCAFAICPAGSIFAAEFGPATYYVCHYNPPGNVIGEFAQNVQV